MNSRLPTPFRGLRRRLAERAAESDIWDAVQLAREDGRPYTLDYASRLVDEWVELHGDRAGTDDHAIVAGIGSFRGRTIAIIGHQKGRDLKERAFRNFGMAQPQGYAKARRVFALADRLGFPVVTMIDTPGAYPGVEAEQAGQAAAIAQSMLAMVRLRVPTVACVIGEGGSGGALAIGVADRVLMLEHAIYSVISPEGCATILWRDVNQRKKAAAAFKPTARFSYELGVVDTVVGEPSGGAHKDHDRAARLLGDAIAQALDSIEAEPVECAAPHAARSSAAWACGSRTASSWARRSPTPPLSPTPPRRPPEAARGSADYFGGEGRQQRLGDRPHGLAGALRGGAHARVRVGLGDALGRHQHALRALDDLARLERVGQRLRFLARLGELGAAGLGGRDGGQHVVLPERLDEVAEGPGLARLLHDVALGERRHHHDRHLALGEDAPRRLDAVELGHAHVHQDDVRRELLRPAARPRRRRAPRRRP